MAEMNVGDHPMELEEIDVEVDDIKEISTVLLEEKIEKLIKPEVEFCGVRMENCDPIATETIDNAVEPSVRREEYKDSTALAEETVPAEEEGGRMASYLRDNFMVITIAPAKKVPSRYLRGPYVSCHNLCKYGHHSNSEEIAKSSSLSKIRNSRALCAGTSPRTSKMKAMVRRLSFPRTKAERQKRLLVDGTDQSPTHKNELKAKRLGVRSSPSSPCALSPLSRKQNAEVKPEKKLMIRRSVSHRIGNAVGSVSEPNGISLRPEGASVSAKPKPPIKKAASMNPRIYRNLKGVPHAGKLNSINESKVQQPDDVPEKTLYMIESSDEQKTKGDAQSVMPSDSVSPSSEAKQVTKTKVSKGGPNGIRKPRPSFPASSFLSTRSSLAKTKIPSQPRVGEQETAGHVHGKQDDSILLDGMAKDTRLIAKSDVETKKKFKRSEISQSAIKDSSMRKLKFRRGTEIVLPGTDGSPRKMLFNRGKTLGEIQHGDEEAGNRSLELKEVIDVDPKQTTAESEKVILRHQETSGRKDSPNLNYVIEEKASELVKTRKSKVKALVGAFETVMSLESHNSAVESAAS